MQSEQAATDPSAAWLTIQRTSAEDIKERELYVSLDGARLGILKYGDSATVPISAGHHELRVHNTLSRKKMQFDAEPRQHVRFKSANVPGKGFAYWAFFLGGVAEDEQGARTMGAWAIHETRMRIGRRRSTDGREGWNVTWQGRGWDRSLEDYLALVRAASDLTRSGELLTLPSVKYHLPRLDEPFNQAEYRYTTRRIAEA